MSRNPTSNIHEGAEYYAGDITSKTCVSKLLEIIKPQVIFHAAAPLAHDTSITAKGYHQIIVEGTESVISCAKSAPSVKALVFTSSALVARGHKHLDIDESAPLWEQNTTDIPPYMKAKTLADIIVREANTKLDSQGNGLLTVALRPHGIYGTSDTILIPKIMEVVPQKWTKYQIGDNKTFHSPSFAGSIAVAHILAARKLLESDSIPAELRVDGEAFFINEGPILFWDFCHVMWRVMGVDVQKKDVVVVPVWLILGIVYVVELLFGIFTLRQKRPPAEMTTFGIKTVVSNYTYNTEKARKRLGFVPVCDLEENLRKCIEWEFENHPEKWKGCKLAGKK
ncbi:hypothetical protein G7Y89_g11400 [Cudoniella acicularis]|uniref:3-beta hydroxysteroid dehydrogenase/isomerase domain-containing protein n=1 Tax=Cudoniella acicularis TaxID=354080 RepID=A0A8H4RDK0_9HELO|nr:hypothetical protein G7Y89_g11400 [Cudoniella acicularis]